MSEQSDEKDANCPVPECNNGCIRVPVVVERVLYGHTEKFVRMDDFQCEECGGLGRVPAPLFPPEQRTPDQP